MHDWVNRFAYGVMSAFISAGIAMGIVYWASLEVEVSFFLMFMIPSFFLGMLIGERFCQGVADLLRQIWW